ncbi:MAG TPA: dihydrolipoamide acetyltransferase family protein [Myxococcales bacterium]|nr:dihydrolipoamide acetyltransferase family protein [Myxococcales bacterium]
MATFEFKLPDIGEGVVEGEIVKWLVKEGDQVAEDQPLVEVMTDKATVTIPSPRKGKVSRTFGKEGEIARVHHPLVTLETDGAAAAPNGSGAPAVATAAVATAAAAGTQGPPASAPARTDGGGGGDSKVLATPVTRRIAREHGLSLSSIAGSGPQGRVTKADVMAAIDGKATAAVPARAKPPAPAPLQPGQADQRVPLRGLRRKIAEKMVRSKTTAPHFTFVEEMDATELVGLRKRLNESLAASGDTAKLSFLPFLVKATIAALRKFPHLNANMDEATQELVVRGEYNLGIAAATDEGLTVPVLHGADRLSIRDLASEIARLAAAARDRKLKVEELTGGTFTITSLGQQSGLFATPIINHPEVAILGVHRIRKRPVVVDDQVVIREMMHLSLSSDHRVIDGQVGALFTYELIKYLERPELLFMELT